MTLIDRSLKGSHSGWAWYDTTKTTYRNWQSSYPHTSYHDCAYIGDSSSGQWKNTYDCGSTKLYYACKKKANFNTSSSGVLSQGSCENGWVSLGSKCYQVHTTKVDYFAAGLSCQAKNAKLVTLHSSKEESDFARVFNNCDTPWLGIENPDPNKVRSNVGWTWNDNTKVDYHNWKTLRNDKEQQCAILEKGSTQWLNTHCWELHPFVCEKPNSSAAS